MLRRLPIRTLVFGIGLRAGSGLGHALANRGGFGAPGPDRFDADMLSQERSAGSIIRASRLSLGSELSAQQGYQVHTNPPGMPADGSLSSPAVTSSTASISRTVPGEPDLARFRENRLPESPAGIARPA